MEKLNSKQIKELCKLQHKIVISQYLISKMPLAYTNFDLDRLERDMKIRSACEDSKEKTIELVKEYGSEIIENTFKDNEYMKKEENRFTFEDQRQATKEVIGKELTLEEVFEKY